MRVLIICFLVVLASNQTTQAQNNQNVAGEGGSSFVPVFLQPAINSIRNTFTSRQPTIVNVDRPARAGSNTNRANARNSVGSSAAQSRRDRLAGPGLVDNGNPWEGTNFGRIKNEIDYFDSVSGSYQNQYDYMALLRQRNDTARFNEVASYVQKNGVYNPAKYSEAVRRLNRNSETANTSSGAARNDVGGSGSYVAPKNSGSSSRSTERNTVGGSGSYVAPKNSGSSSRSTERNTVGGPTPVFLQ